MGHLRLHKRRMRQARSKADEDEQRGTERQHAHGAAAMADSCGVDLGRQSGTTGRRRSEGRSATSLAKESGATDCLGVEWPSGGGAAMVRRRGGAASSLGPQRLRIDWLRRVARRRRRRWTWHRGRRTARPLTDGFAAALAEWRCSTASNGGCGSTPRQCAVTYAGETTSSSVDSALKRRREVADLVEQRGSTRRLDEADAASRR
jgi:hypothetical protein